MCTTVLHGSINSFVFLDLSWNRPCNLIIHEDWLSQRPTCFTSFAGTGIKNDKQGRYNLLKLNHHTYYLSNILTMSSVEKCACFCPEENLPGPKNITQFSTIP